MINKITQFKINLLLVCAFVFISNYSFSQTTIATQDFEQTPASPEWGYSISSNIVFASLANKFNGQRSLRMGASDIVTFDNIDISGYSDVVLSVAFAALGVDSNEDLFMDISYDNGNSWTGVGSIKLVDGYSNANVNINATNASNPTTVSSNPYPTTISSSETSVKVRFRIDQSLEASEYYFIDDVTITGNIIPTGPYITTDEYNLPSFGMQDELTYSSSKSFLASGANLTANVVVTAPSANYEVSLDDATWSSSVSIIPSSGSFSNFPVYVRFYPQSSGTKSENIILSSTGATDTTVGVVGTGVIPQLATPVATAATSIASTSFVANWNAVSGANNYVIDVSSSPTFTASGGFTTDLLISEYIEGSSNNKYIEIFNGTGSDVDLSDYELQLFANGSSSPISNALSGTLSTGNTKVFKNSGANIYAGPATVSSSTNFNGDDAVALYKISTSSFVDIFGVIGNDPGSNWSIGGNKTENQTLVRKGFVFGGVTTNPSTFSTLGTDWTSYPEDTVSNLGTHSFDGGLSPSYVTGYENLSVGNVTSVTVSGLTQGVTYYYRVRATGANTSENSNVINLTTVLTSVTWNGNEWSNTTGPDSSLEAIIEGAYTTTTNQVLAAKKITINSGSLTISPNSTVEIQNELINNLTAAAVVVESNGNLRQYNNVANTGEITVRRNSANALRLDYTAWSSPVSGQNALAFSPATLANRFYDYSPATNAYTAIIPSTTDFTTGKGILIRTPNNWTSDVNNPMPYPGEFKGVLNNGDITNVSLTAGYNFLGNPYASPIDATSFLTNANNQGATVGMTTMYFWTHYLAADASGSYAYNGTSNYATFNGAAGIAATAGGQEPDGIIQVGQGFLVDVNAAGNAEFTNSMRLSASNGQFFKSANQTTTIEKHRMWLGLTSPQYNHNQIAVGYIGGATNDLDPALDAKLFGESNSVIYSTINSSKYVIQSRALPFTSSDIVPLGFIAHTAGQYTISINKVDGLFNSQDIYLKDNLLNIIHDIKASAYTYVSDIGQFDSRFEIVYAAPLAVEIPTLNESSAVVYKNESGINVNAGEIVIDNVKVFDIRGRLLLSKSNINDSSIILENSIANNQVLIIQISTLDNQTISKKIVN